MKNQITGEYGAVPDTARQYKVGLLLKSPRGKTLEKKAYEIFFDF